MHDLNERGICPINKKNIRDIVVTGKRVLVRVDFNVPLDKKTGEITDTNRIKATLPTIKYLIDHKAKIIICSHLGRPNGAVTPELTLAPVAERLSQLLDQPVHIAKDCVGSKTKAAVAKLKAGEVLLLENLRFHAEEEKNDPEFAQSLASLADIYVNDAFGAAHRAHASTEGVTHYIPSVAGFLMENELEFLGEALADPARPFAMIIGGAKVSSKIILLENILSKVDALIIGGGMANTFLKAQGYAVGKSKVEGDQVEFAKNMIFQAKERGVNLLLPSDVVVAERFEAESPNKTIPVDKVPEDQMILDIGPETVVRFSSEIRPCQTVVWNGPMGVFEFPAFARGTKAIASLLAKMKSHATTIIGGGDSAAAVEKLGLADKMSHVSTGGGASLKFLEGNVLPGVAALNDK